VALVALVGRPDQWIGGRYRLERLLGQGAMGEVWQAIDTRTSVTVALKLVSLAGDDGASARMEREARAASAIVSNHVVRIFHFGVDGPIAFIAMELLRGETLSARLRRAQRLGPVETVAIVRQVALGLAVAHRFGIIHRDLKPDNLFLAETVRGEEVKILDFGIAKLFADRSQQTQQGVVVGTPAYLSQEQILGTHNVDARTDFWALAIIAFECLTGRLPYDATTVAELFVQIVGPARTRAVERANLAPAFREWFLRATDKDPNERFESGKEFVEELRRALLPEAVGDEAQLDTSVKLTARPRRKKLLALLGALLGITIVLLALATRAILQGGREAPLAATSSPTRVEVPPPAIASVPTNAETPVVPEPKPSAGSAPTSEPTSLESAEPSAVPSGAQPQPPAATSGAASSRPRATRPRDRWGLGI
jgi:eukaryotic-like serine/threonine-protein kinase